MGNAADRQTEIYSCTITATRKLNHLGAQCLNYILYIIIDTCVQTKTILFLIQRPGHSSGAFHLLSSKAVPVGFVADRAVTMYCPAIVITPEFRDRIMEDTRNNGELKERKLQNTQKDREESRQKGITEKVCCFV
jgi:hypothetical protein